MQDASAQVVAIDIAGGLQCFQPGRENARRNPRWQVPTQPPEPQRAVARQSEDDVAHPFLRNEFEEAVRSAFGCRRRVGSFGRDVLDDRYPGGN